jgi:SPP1 family phage portal protein
MGMIIKTEKLTEEEIHDAIKVHESSQEYKRLLSYYDYYQAKNPALLNRWVDRERRRKVPNWYVPSAYFSTVIDTMAGYMFQKVDYSCGNEQIEQTIRNVLDANNQEVKDMISGTYALAFNRSYEVVYTEGDDPTIKYACLDPRQCIPIYDDKIEPDMFALIWKRRAPGDQADLIDVIYADEWQYWMHGMQKFAQREKTRKLYFPFVPVVEGRTEMIGDQSPFHIVLPYIEALDWAITGNSNEIDRIVDALLLLGRHLDDEDLMHMDEWRTLEGIQNDELKPEYLTKNLSPEFRKYVTDLLINEIHKHSHVIDWYNADTAGDASAKALKTRLFDMDMYSKRLEKVYIKAMYKRIDLIAHLLGLISGIESEPVTITLNRTVPTDYESKMESLKGVDWYSTETKVELTGGDWEVEKERLEAEFPVVNLEEVR